MWSAETGHDRSCPWPSRPSTPNGWSSGTGIAVAFGRNPMITGQLSAWDLNVYSPGPLPARVSVPRSSRHIEKRYSMPWSHPAPRMREFISAMRAIWDCWQNGTKLDFRGDFYTHTLMTPFFNPGPTTVRPAPGLPGCGRRGHDQGGRRGRRRHAGRTASPPSATSGR